MITTSYFAQLKHIENPLSICGRAPDWYTGPQYKMLAPKYWFFKEYKEGNIDQDKYTELFIKHVLVPLDAQQVYNYLCAEYGRNVTLLCYEKPGDFCHRHIVANWFNNNLNIKVEELKFNKGDALWK